MLKYQTHGFGHSQGWINVKSNDPSVVKHQLCVASWALGHSFTADKAAHAAQLQQAAQRHPLVACYLQVSLYCPLLKRNQLGPLPHTRGHIRRRHCFEHVSDISKNNTVKGGHVAVKYAVSHLGQDGMASFTGELHLPSPQESTTTREFTSHGRWHLEPPKYRKAGSPQSHR